MIPFALEPGRPVVMALVAVVGTGALVAMGSRWRHAPRFLFVLLVALVAGDLRARDPDPPRLRIFVVDRSRSFERAGEPVQAALELGVRDLDAARDRVALIAFGATPRVVLEPSSPAEVREGARRAVAAQLDATTSDLGAAIDLALDLSRSERAAGEIVLLTDGRDTAGRARAAAARAAAAGVPVHAVAPPALELANARVARVTAPARVAVGEAARVTVEVESSVAGRIRTTLAVASGEATVVGGAVEDAVDADAPIRRTFLVRAAKAGLVTLTASVELAGKDAYGADDSQEVAILAGDRSRAVLVGESAAWRSVLEAAKFEVERIEPEDLEKNPEKVLAGPPVALVVLNEVSAARAPVRVLSEHIASGGGLVVSGDRHAFGPGDYADSSLEALLPVRSGPPDTRSKPLVLTLVIDGSGSMGARLSDGKTRFTSAVNAVVPLPNELRAGDHVGVVVFAGTPAVVSIEELPRWEPRGETNIGAGLELGLDELARREGKRLLVLVTDAEDEKLKDHLPAIRARAEKLGPDFHMALVGIGREAADKLKVVQQEIGKSASVHQVDEAGKDLEKLVKGDLVNGSRGERRVGRFPATGGFVVASYAPVRPKELVKTAISVQDPDRQLPAALAVLGERVLAVATDLDGGGAALRGAGLTLLTELVRAVARREASDLELEAERQPGWIRIVARTARQGLVAKVGETRVPFQPVAPGMLEARLRGSPRLVLVLEGDRPLAGLVVPPESSLELAAPRRDLELLGALVAPNGTILPELRALPRPSLKETQRALAGPLALAALAFLVLEGAVSVVLERLAARRAARRTFENS